LDWQRPRGKSAVKEADRMVLRIAVSLLQTELLSARRDDEGCCYYATEQSMINTRRPTPYSRQQSRYTGGRVWRDERGRGRQDDGVLREMCWSCLVVHLAAWHMASVSRLLLGNHNGSLFPCRVNHSALLTGCQCSIPTPYTTTSYTDVYSLVCHRTHLPIRRVLLYQAV